MRSLIVVAAGIAAVTVVAFGCEGRSSDHRLQLPIEVNYVGNPNGVYHAECDPVQKEPAGRIVEIRAGDSLIDATNEYLPDGLKVIGPDSKTVTFADCRDYTVQVARTTPPPTLTTPETTPTTVPQSNTTTTTTP